MAFDKRPEARGVAGVANLIGEGLDHPVVHRAGSDGVDADVRGAEFHGRDLYQAEHGMLAGNIRRQCREADRARNGRERNDRSAARRFDGRRRMLHCQPDAVTLTLSISKLFT